MSSKKEIILKVENLMQTFTTGEDFIFWKNKQKVNAVNNVSFEVEKIKLWDSLENLAAANLLLFAQ